MRWIAIVLMLCAGCATTKPKWKVEVKPIEKSATITIEGSF